MRSMAVGSTGTSTLRRIVILRLAASGDDAALALADDSMAVETVERLEDVSGIGDVDAIVFGPDIDIESVCNAAQRIRQANPMCLRIHVHTTPELLTPRLYDTVHQSVPYEQAVAAMVPTLERCFRLRDSLARANVDDALSGLESLPSLPHVYHEFVRASQCESVDFGELADIVEHDLALTARILGLANSAHFGLRTSVTSIKQAISVIGIEMLSSLVTATSLFGALTEGGSARRLERLWMHASKLSQLALSLAMSEARLTRADRAEVALAGLLHDIGQLVIMTRMPALHAVIDQTSVHDGEEVCEVERRELGATHAEIGACLLAYWGISERTVTAVTLHHDIQAAARHDDPVVWSVFAANAILAQTDGMTASYRAGQVTAEDELESHFGPDRVGKWRFALTNFTEA